MEGYIRTKEVAELLGIPLSAVKRLRLRRDPRGGKEADPLPCYRIGHRTVRYRAAEIVAWVARQGGQ